MEGRPCWCEVEDGEAMAVDVRRKPREEGVVAAAVLGIAVASALLRRLVR